MRSLFIISLLVVTGCASPMTRSGSALVNNLKDSGHATSAKESTKQGQSCQTNILGIANTGDGSIETAKKAGGIETVSSVDYEVFSVLGLYAKVCTIVKGN